MNSNQSDYSYAEDEELVNQFLGWTGDAVKELRELADSMDGSETAKSPSCERMYDLAHNIKGMGSSFNFDLMTTIGTSLCRYIKHREGTISARAIDAHVRIFEVVLTNKITGDGGEKGQALEARLNEIIVEEA